MKEFDQLLDELNFDEPEAGEAGADKDSSDDEKHFSYKKLKSLSTYFERVNREIDPDLALNITVDFLSSQLGFDSMILFSTEEEGGHKVILNREFYGAQEEVVSFFDQSGIFDWCTANRKFTLSHVDTVEQFCLLIPLLAANRSVGFLAAFYAEEKGLSQPDMELVKIVSTQLAFLVDRIRLDQTLIAKDDTMEIQLQEITGLYDELKYVFEFTRKIGKVLEQEPLNQLIVETFVQVFEVEKAVLLSGDEDAYSFVCASGTGPDGLDNLDVQGTIISYFAAGGGPVNDFLHNKRYTSFTRTGLEENTMLGAPLRKGDRKVGLVILAGRVMNRPFKENHSKLLRSLLRQAGYTLERIDLHKEKLEKQKIQRDLELAGKIQLSLLPDSSPEFPGLDMFSFFKPASSVGGDFYDYITRPDGRIVGVIGDVSGKGISAALLMANIRSIVRAVSLQPQLSLPDAMYKINELVCDEILPGKFVTLLYFLLEPGSFRISFVSAGHNPLFHFKTGDGSIGEYMAGSVPVGLVSGEKFIEDSFELSPGDVAFLYTDGLNEARSSSDEEFGMNRIRQCIISSRNSNAEGISNTISDQWLEHTRGVPQFDDTTYVVIKRGGQSG